MIDNFLPLLRGDKRHKQGRNAVIREEGGVDLVGATVESAGAEAGRSACTARKNSVDPERCDKKHLKMVLKLSACGWAAGGGQTKLQIGCVGK